MKRKIHVAPLVGLATLVLVLPNLKPSPPAQAYLQPPTEVTLDFEDGLFPSTHGWQKYLVDQGTHTIVPGDAGSGGSLVLEISGENYFGWYLDLEGLVDLHADWSYSADVRCVTSCTNDVGIARYGLGNGGVAESQWFTDGQWHNLRLEMDHAANLVRSYVDGVLIRAVAPFDHYYPWQVPTANSITFGFGNLTQYRVAQFDNIHFGWQHYTLYVPFVSRNG